jgi:hypothetical protein
MPQELITNRTDATSTKAFLLPCKIAWSTTSLAPYILRIIHRCDTFQWHVGSRAVLLTIKTSYEMHSWRVRSHFSQWLKSRKPWGKSVLVIQFESHPSLQPLTENFSFRYILGGLHRSYSLGASRIACRSPCKCVLLLPNCKLERQPTFRKKKPASKQVTTLSPAFTLVSCSAYSSTLKMETICSSETSVDFQWTTRHYIPDDSAFCNHRCEKLSS